MAVAWTVLFRGRTHDFIVILLYRIVVVIHKNHSPKRKLSRELTGILTFRLRLSLAVAVNREVVPRPLWRERQFAAGDKVDIVRAIGGG